MAYIYFDSSYAPCSFLIVKNGGDPYKEEDTILISSDWDYPGVASRLGWSPAEIWHISKCKHNSTDGSIDCKDCGTLAMNFINSAYEWIKDNEGDRFNDLDEYFSNSYI